MCCITVGRFSAGLIIVQSRNDVEGIQSAVLGVTYIDKLTVQVFSQLGILIFRVKNKNLTVLCCQICQKALCGIGLTGTGFTNNDHIGVDAFTVSAEEIHKDRNTLTLTQANTANIRNIRIDPRICRRKRVAGDAASFLVHRIPCADLGANEGFHLGELHVVQPDAVFLPSFTNNSLHIRNPRQKRLAGCNHIGIVFCGNQIVGSDINAEFQQRFIILLQGSQKAS